MRRIGVLMGYAESDAAAQAQVAALRQELRKLGWEEGRTYCERHMCFKMCRVVRVERRHTSPGRAKCAVACRAEPGVASSHWNCEVEVVYSPRRAGVILSAHSQPLWRRATRAIPATRRPFPHPPLGRGPSMYPARLDRRARGGLDRGLFDPWRSLC
jgi:hypothetical protein